MTRDEAISFLNTRPADEPVLVLPGSDPLAHLVSQDLIRYSMRLDDPAAAEQFQRLQRQMQRYLDRVFSSEIQ